MTLELKIPYFDLQLFENVNIEPKQLNNDLYINLKDNLSKKVLNKCNKYGYITKIYKIDEYSDGLMLTENFNGNIKYSLKYSARICNPLENTSIICIIEGINKILIKAVNGPIIIIIKRTDINNTFFNINNKGDIMYKDQKLKSGDSVIVNIIAKKFNYNDARICAICSLERIATETEIKDLNEIN